MRIAHLLVCCTTSSLLLWPLCPVPASDTLTPPAVHRAGPPEIYTLQVRQSSGEP